MEPDFSLLYSELKLPPDCTLEDFRCAYRRRIAELHPDRKGGKPTSPEADAALSALISTYVAVNRFHSRHGRMPGASHRSATGNLDRATGASSRTVLPVSLPTGNDPERPARPTWRLVIVFVALLVLLASWDWLVLTT